MLPSLALDLEGLDVAMAQGAWFASAIPLIAGLAFILAAKQFYRKQNPTAGIIMVILAIVSFVLCGLIWLSVYFTYHPNFS